MPFIHIGGHFKPGAGRPDGDSVRFQADNPNLWGLLEGRPVPIGSGPLTQGTAQLRLEGIDAIEKGATKPLSTDATDNLLALLGYDPGNNPEPRGSILTRMTEDKGGRPISYLFVGEPKWEDGSEVFLTHQMLRDTVNYQQMKAGFAYPLYYNTLFADLRSEFSVALAHARQNASGYWPHDRTTSGVTVTSRADLAATPPIWPKLWRRLHRYFGNAHSLADFVDFLEEEDERVDILSIMEERGLQDLVEVQGDNVRLVEPPENLRIVARAGRRRR